MDATELAFSGIARQAELIRPARSPPGARRPLPRADRAARPAAERFPRRLPRAGARGGRRGRPPCRCRETAPLLGVPIALKDEIDVEGELTTHGSAGFDRPADADASHYRRLREAGAVLIGKTNLSELAIWPFTETEAWGETRNPWDRTRTCGGSSGGSGAAVAAGLVGAASASDGGGSIRIPAAFNGVYGLKPQRGGSASRRSPSTGSASRSPAVSPAASPTPRSGST